MTTEVSARLAASNLNPFDPAWVPDPYPLYSHLREQGDLVRLPEGFYVAARHEPAQAVLRDFENFGSENRMVRRGGELGPAFDGLKDMIQFMEPPAHSAVRSLMMSAFTPKRISQLEASTDTIIDELLEKPTRDGGMDFAQDFAYLLPLIIITRLLGVPSEDMMLFREWADGLALAQGRKPSPQVLAGADAAMNNALQYFADMVKARRTEPQDDLISAYIAAEESGSRMSERQILVNSFLLIIAGHESTANLMANGINAFFDFPDQWKALLADPELTSRAVEEALRYDPPIQMLTRLVNRDIEYAGLELRRDQSIAVILGSANRDEAVFHDADRFDIARKPGPHIAFGFGRHFCLGSQLARMEARLAYNSLIKRFPNLRRAGEGVRLKTETIRGFSSLPVQF